MPPPEVRSRNGCAQCRRRRRKCSEERPRCRGCLQRDVACEYTSRAVQWVEVATVQQGQQPQPQRPSQQFQRSQRSQRHPRRCQPTTCSQLQPEQPPGPGPGPGSGLASASASVASATSPPLSNRQQLRPESCHSDAEAHEAVASLFRLSSGHFSPFAVDSAMLVADDPGFADTTTTTINASCLGPQVQSNAVVDNGQVTASVIYVDSSSSSSSSGSSVRRSSNDDSQSLDGWDFNDDDLSPGIDSNAFDSPGERIAFAYWSNYLARVLPAHDSDENPYQRLSSLAMSSPVLLDTIISLATEYMYCHGHTSPELVALRHEKAIASLKKALQTASCHEAISDTLSPLSPAQATLAAVLLQIANTVFTGGPGVDTHITCAAYLLREQGYIDTPTQEFLPRLLVQRFAILDVTTAILRRRKPHLPMSFWLFVPDETYDRTSPSFREMTGCPQPVLGFYARLSHLASDLKDSGGDQDKAYAILRKASTLDTDMRIYARSRVRFTTNRPSPARHLDTLSQCFYWCAHLILQRVIYRDSAASPRVQQTVKDIVMLIKSMPLGCGPDSSLAFPFYVSSREAVTEEHQTWVRQRNEELKRVYPGRTRDTLMLTLEQIWAVTADINTDSCKLRGDVDSVIEGLERSRDFCLF
ncbi:fungal specific transcription factor domain-containing protein [Sarocladium implicatum]|nr:fungal specific transcription factor domain-containing protein [Sarocladium implicatum]